MISLFERKMSNHLIISRVVSQFMRDSRDVGAAGGESPSCLDVSAKTEVVQLERLEATVCKHRKGFQGHSAVVQSGQVNHSSVWDCEVAVGAAEDAVGRRQTRSASDAAPVVICVRQGIHYEI